MSGTDFTINPDDPRREAVLALLQRHWDFTVTNSPEGACYTFNADELADPAVTFWTARRNETVLGAVALLERRAEFGELKSLHVVDAARGTGLGEALVNHVIETARERGMTMLGLETGTSEGFAASRRLYKRLGFVHGPAFPPYKDETFSYCMTLGL